MSIDQTIFCSICFKPSETMYATYTDEENNAYHCCTRKCYLVYQTNIRAVEIGKKEKEDAKKLSDRVKKITESQPLKGSLKKKDKNQV
jgi:hypothetical protein